MLLALEGGFQLLHIVLSLALLISDWRNKVRSMKVMPWNQYQLVDQETGPDRLLASSNKWHVWGSTSFLCFGCTATRRKGSSPLKLGPTPNQEVSPACADFDESQDQVISVDPIRNNIKIAFVKSILKKSVNSIPVGTAVIDHGNTKEDKETLEKDGDVACQINKPKVQWTDTIGGELFEVREFEMSETESEDELTHASGGGDTCSGRCLIM